MGRIHHWVPLLALALLGGCEAAGDDDDTAEDPNQVEGGLSECDSSAPEYTEVDGVWAYTMDGVDTGTWRFGVTWGSYGDGNGLMGWYGCVINDDPGDAPEGAMYQPYEFTGSVVLAESTTDATIVPGSVGLDVNVFQAALNRYFDDDNDVWSIFSGSAGSGTIETFDAAAGILVGSVDATADLTAQDEADDLPAHIQIEFDLSWEP